MSEILKPEVRKSFEPSQKDERIGLRISSAQKSEVVSAAESVGCTITDYLLGLHKFALREKSEDAASS